MWHHLFNALIWAAGVVLVACGGNAERDTTLTQQLPSDPPPAHALELPPAVPEPDPAPSVPDADLDADIDAPPASPLPAWQQAWLEPWDAMHLGGWLRHSVLQCAGGRADPDQLPGSFFGVPGARWAAFGGVNGTLHAADGTLTIDSHQGGTGYAVLSWPNWSHLQPIAIEASIDLRPDPGAWLGFALIADESDYRELSLYEAGGGLRVGVWHPCVVQADLARVQPGSRHLRMEYTPPPAEVCWRHYVDHELVGEERCDNPGAPLVSPPRVGLYIVNSARGPDGRKSGGYVRATVGPITVQQGVADGP